MVFSGVSKDNFLFFGLSFDNVFKVYYTKKE